MKRDCPQILRLIEGEGYALMAQNDRRNHLGGIGWVGEE